MSTVRQTSVQLARLKASNRASSCMAMSDFQSLLSTFQAATGTPSTSGTVQRTPNGEKEKSILELTTQLWRLSQLQLSTRATPNRAPSKPQNSSVRLAVCLCIVDDLPHEHIWKYWIEESSSGDPAPPKTSADLYIHAKHPDRIRSNWVRRKLIPVSHKPDWNDVRIVKAILSLVEAALQDPNVTHILFGTESCLPIVPRHETIASLDPSKSYVAYFDKRQASRFDERRCWNAVEPHVPVQAIYKALPGWCCLCRTHAQAIHDMPHTHLAGRDLWPAFENCWAPEEVYFPTCLALLGYLPQDTIQRGLTYAEWNLRAHNERDRAHPKAFDDEFNAGLVAYLRRKHDCKFLRKIKHPMPLRQWRRAVESGGGDTRDTRERYDDTGREDDYRRRRRRGDERDSTSSSASPWNHHKRYRTDIERSSRNGDTQRPRYRQR